MKIARFFALAGPGLISLVFLAQGGRCLAQQRNDHKPPTEQEKSSWYYEPAAKVAPQRSIAQQKAIARSEQRMARLAAARSYGYSASRPNATAGSFTTMYSAPWTYGRTCGWFVSLRPTVIVTPPTTSYR